MWGNRTKRDKPWRNIFRLYSLVVQTPILQPHVQAYPTSERRVQDNRSKTAFHTARQSAETALAVWRCSKPTTRPCCRFRSRMGAEIPLNCTVRQEVIPFFAFPPAVRKIIYTTNAIESLNRVIRKTTKTRGSFPTDEAATKLIYLAIRNFEKAGRCVREWVAARNQFAILYPERSNK
jgi:hypothetical protein